MNQKYPDSHEDKILEITADKVISNGHRYLRVGFKDYGEGISAKHIEKVMHPFFSTKTGKKRTGLGLSICHAIIEEHGGHLKIDSKEGEYTRVMVDLPLKAGSEQ